MITFEKNNELPLIVYLDTNIIIRIAHKQEDELYNFLVDLVYKGKIICPIGLQREEYIISKVSDDCDQILVNLSKGNKFRFDLEYNQIDTLVKMFLDNSNDYIINSAEGIKVNEGKEGSGFQVVIFTTDKQRRSENLRLTDHLVRRKEFIKKNNIKQKELLKEESGARRQMFEKSIKDAGPLELDKTQKYSSEYCNQYPLLSLEKYTGVKKNLDLAERFILSDYFENIPFDFVHSSLVTKILLDNSNIKNTDVMDLSLIAKALPYSHYFITEKQRKVDIEQLKLHSKYNVRVFSINDIEQFKKELIKDLEL